MAAPRVFVGQNYMKKVVGLKSKAVVCVYQPYSSIRRSHSVLASLSTML